MNSMLKYGWIIPCICVPIHLQAQDSTRDDPAVEFLALENRLLAASTVRLSFHVTAEGAVEVDLIGELDVTPTTGIRLTATGEFAGQPFDLQLLPSDGFYQFSNGTDRNSSPEPAHLKQALLIGLTRMGILHNLARLTGAAPPDHADGGVSEWVVVDSFAPDGIDQGALSFDITVSGEPSGSASLRIDSSGLPSVRRQTVQFEFGEMRVVERYSDVTINP